MTRIALVFVLSLVVTAPAMACGMSYQGITLSGALGSIDEVAAVDPAAEQRAERLAVNWIDEVGEVPLGSVRRSERRARRAQAADPEPVAELPVEQPASLGRTEQVQAFLRAWLQPGPADHDTGEPADSGL